MHFYVIILTCCQSGADTWHRDRVFWKRILKPANGDPERKIVCRDHSRISKKCNMPHPVVYKVPEKKQLLRDYLIGNAKFYNNHQLFNDLRLYITQTSLLPKCSQANLNIATKHPIFVCIMLCFLKHYFDIILLQQAQKTQIAKWDSIIGNALLTINPFQMRVFFALIYNLIQYDAIVTPHTADTSIQYEQTWDYQGEQVTTTEPGIAAPTSTVIFWSKRLRIHQTADPEYFDSYGYCSRQHLESEMRGLYLFYQKSR